MSNKELNICLKQLTKEYSYPEIIKELFFCLCAEETPKGDLEEYNYNFYLNLLYENFSKIKKHIDDIENI